MTDFSTVAARVFALACWCIAVWVPLTWTRTAEQIAFGAAVSLAVAVVLAPLGPVAGPWRLLDPRVAKRTAGLAFVALGRVAGANVRLARRIWSPSLPLRSGMVIVPTTQRSELGLTTVGVVSSLIVDNQIVDLDRSRGRLLYHAVDVPPRGPEAARERINPVDNFDPDYGTTFLTYATPIIAGAEDVARHLDLPLEEVVDAYEAVAAYHAGSLDMPVTPTDAGATTVGDLLGYEDPGIDLVVDREALKPLLEDLTGCPAFCRRSWTGSDMG